MSKKDILKEKAKAKLATSSVKVEVVKNALVLTGNTELRNITREIKSDLDEMRDISDWWAEKKARVNELKENIITKLIYVRDNKKSLLPVITFESYLVDEIGISKGYFYEQLQAYNVCIEYKNPKLFKEVDHKVLVNIAREGNKDKQKELIGRASELNRDFFKKDKEEKKVSPTDFSETKNNHTSSSHLRIVKSTLSYLESFKKTYDEEKNSSSEPFLRGYISGIIGLSEILLENGQISPEEFEKIKKYKIKT